MPQQHSERKRAAHLTSQGVCVHEMEELATPIPMYVCACMYIHLLTKYIYYAYNNNTRINYVIPVMYMINRKSGHPKHVIHQNARART